MKSFSQFLAEAETAKYNDEHAHARVWNHMVENGIHPSKVHDEIEKGRTNKSHPLHYSHKSADPKGFSGGKPTPAHKESHDAEMATSGHTIHAMLHHPDFKHAVKHGHNMKVMGASVGKVSDTWKKHGAGNGTSKSDIAVGPKGAEHTGIQVSMKKGDGSQLMSAGGEETSAVHDHAAREMLRKHATHMTQSEQDAHHKYIMDHMSIVSHHLEQMRGQTSAVQEHHRVEGQKVMNKIHGEYPKLNGEVRKEATTGRGKFGAHSGSAATYLVKSAGRGTKASIEHVDDHDYSGPIPRVAKPKGDGRPGNVKCDEKKSHS